MFGINRQNRSVRVYPKVVVYGTLWCAGTQMARRYLERQGIAYTFHDIDQEAEAADRVRWWTGGSLSHPTIQIGGDILVEPSPDELERSLEQHRMV
jgi:mycoredoxin